MADEQLSFSAEAAAMLERRLPPAATSGDGGSGRRSGQPFVTLTFATSLDSALSLAPGVRTRLSGPASKAMTHFLRSRHTAILVGAPTVLADDPALNCRLVGATSQPRPVILDPHLRWAPRRTDKVLQTSRVCAGLAPFVLTGIPASQLPRDSVELLHEHGGKFIHIAGTHSDAHGNRVRFAWPDVLEALRVEGLSSVMVEGGGRVINSLLHPACRKLIDSVIVTIAPTWLGQGGVVISPERSEDSQGNPVPAARLSDVSWHPLGDDVVLSGRLHA